MLPVTQLGMKRLRTSDPLRRAAEMPQTLMKIPFLYINKSSSTAQMAPLPSRTPGPFRHLVGDFG